jgi:hypothetical protein
MSEFGIKISGALGDIINITPVIKYLSRCHNQRLYLETDLPHLFKNNPYIEKIYDYEGHKVCMANVENEIVSELGNALSSRPQCDFAILWNYDHINEKYNVSMRSTDKVDVSVICKKFGGGGHPNASGCKLEEHPVVVFGKNKK